MDMIGLSKLGIGVSGVIAVGLLIWLLFRSWRRGARKQGAQEVVIESQKGAIDAVDQAKRVEEAVRAGGDADWLERVRRKYRRD
jgi:hypothetical protein